MQVAEKQESGVQWVDICSTGDLIVNSGVCALVEGKQVAIFYLPAEQQKVYAVSNHCPFSRANVIYRGIVGDLQNRLVVASPVYKQHFDLVTGTCLEDQSLSLPVYPVVIEGERVKLAL